MKLQKTIVIEFVDYDSSRKTVDIIVKNNDKVETLEIKLGSTLELNWTIGDDD
jgi:hypothetical protein